MNRTKRPALGFTLIEIMVVVAVVAILAAIAFPSYQESVRKGRRGQAKADLVELAQVLERHYTVNNRYNTAGFNLPFTTSPRTGAPHYNLTIVRDRATFTLTATPTGPHTDPRCGVLTLNQAGVRTRSGTAPIQDCW